MTTQGTDSVERERAAMLTSMGEAGKLLQQGNFDAAIEACRALLETFPYAVGAYYFMGLAEANKGDMEGAAEALSEAVAIRPGYPAYRLSLADVLSKLGRLEEARQQCERALELQPNAQQGLMLLSQIETALGNKDRGRDLLKQVAASGGGPLAGLKRKKQMRGLSDEARSLGVPGGAAETYTEARRLEREGRHDEACATFKKAAAAAPNHPAPVIAAARIDLDSGRPGEAKALLKGARQRMPEVIDLAVLQAEAACGNLDFDEAAGILDAIAEQAANRADYWKVRAMQLTETGHGQAAVEAAEKAMALATDDARTGLTLARALAVSGKLEAARDLARKLTETHPEDIPAHYFLSTIGGLAVGDPAYRQLEKLAEDTTPLRRHRTQARFALGKAAAEAGNAESAFAHYSIGNRLIDVTYRLDWEERKVEDIIAAFPKDRFADFAGLGSDDERPVLIVGMPRSGTTLVEQLVASHPLGAGVGELTELPRIDRNLAAGEGGMSYKTAEKLAALDAETIRALAAQYLEALTAHAPAEARRIADKLPHNFLRLGLFAILFPNGRVIHCTRDPLDTGLSIFFHYFTGTHFYATDLANIGHQIRLHDRIMAHWREVLPVPVHEARYEKLVAEPEPEIRALIDFLGLEWDDRCLAFHETERAVQSASLAQVRQKLYDSAVGRWKPYESHLAPLRQALG